VAAACQQLRPDAVDVSSGVETRPGIKSDKLMNEFIKAVKNG
jgi:phosphoribosylanthranilate isomerase